MSNLLRTAAVALLVALAPFVLSAAPIPDRPEKLKFPELDFQPPDAAQFRVQLKAGPVAYVIPDRELPLVNISILVRCGQYLEPIGREGLASLTGTMLMQGGTAKLSATDLEEQLAFLAAHLSTGVGDTSGNVSLNLLSKDLDEGLALLRDVLATPRFQEDKIELRKRQLLQEMRQRNDDSASIEGETVLRTAFGTNFWATRDITSNSLAAITRAELGRFHQRWFHPGNFVLAVSGDFDRADMLVRLEKLFANWPFKGETPPPIPTDIQFAASGVYVVNKEVNQGRVSLLLPGLMRDDPDYFPAVIMNDILGGGGFTSRIMNRVRTEEGLAYSAGSSLQGGVYYTPPFIASFQTKSRTVPYAVSLVLKEMKQIAAAPVSPSELATTINGMIERFPRAFASKAQVAALFAQEEFTGRFAKDPGYFRTYRDKIRAVTQADVQRAAQRLLKPDQTAIVIVGHREEILLGHPDHSERLHDFAGGKVTELPLLDPLTLEPQGQPRPIAKPN
jgi:zinc protease